MMRGSSRLDRTGVDAEVAGYLRKARQIVCVAEDCEPPERLDGMKTAVLKAASRPEALDM